MKRSMIFLNFQKIFKKIFVKKILSKKKFFPKNLFFKKKFTICLKILKHFENCSLRMQKSRFFGRNWWVTKTTWGHFFHHPNHLEGFFRKGSPYNISDSLPTKIIAITPFLYHRFVKQAYSEFLLGSFAHVVAWSLSTIASVFIPISA